MSNPQPNQPLFVRIIATLALLVGVGLGAWLLSTPSLMASSQSRAVDVCQPDYWQSSVESKQDG